ncbi:MAG: hypothetical protein V8S74_06750 [Lachnospirales bacterium]
MYQNTSKEVFKMSVPIFFELLLQLLVGNIDQIMVTDILKVLLLLLTMATKL